MQSGVTLCIMDFSGQSFDTDHIGTWSAEICQTPQTSISEPIEFCLFTIHVFVLWNFLHTKHREPLSVVTRLFPFLRLSTFPPLHFTRQYLHFQATIIRQLKLILKECFQVFAQHPLQTQKPFYSNFYMLKRAPDDQQYFPWTKIVSGW